MEVSKLSVCFGKVVPEKIENCQFVSRKKLRIVSLFRESRGRKEKNGPSARHSGDC